MNVDKRSGALKPPRGVTAGLRRRLAVASLSRQVSHSCLRTFWFLVCTYLCSSAGALAATKVFLHESTSPLGSPCAGRTSNPTWSDCSYRLADSTQGSSAATNVTTHATGVTAPQETTKTNGGIMYRWITPPLASSVTISGTITPNIWCSESAAQLNLGITWRVLKWDKSIQGETPVLGTSATTMTECATSSAVRTAPTLTPTSTAFAAGDRIVIEMRFDSSAGGTYTPSGSRTATLTYDAATAVSGDTYLSFTETLSFSSDSNTRRALLGP